MSDVVTFSVRAKFRGLVPRDEEQYYVPVLEERASQLLVARLRRWNVRDLRTLLLRTSSTVAGYRLVCWGRVAADASLWRSSDGWDCIGQAGAPLSCFAGPVRVSAGREEAASAASTAASTAAQR